MYKLVHPGNKCPKPVTIQYFPAGLIEMSHHRRDKAVRLAGVNACVHCLSNCSSCISCIIIIITAVGSVSAVF